MKVCRKCKSRNDLQARFCFQCGTRLSTTLTFSRMELPRAQRAALQRPIDLNDFIKHPLQKLEDVITSQNQGQQLSPKLQNRIEAIAPKGLKKKALDQPNQKVLKEAHIPAPMQLKKSPVKPIEKVPQKLKIAVKSESEQSGIGNSKNFKHFDLKSDLSDRENQSESFSLLNIEQKKRLSGNGASKIEGFSAGLKPVNKEFSLARLEQLELVKREKQNQENRQKQLRNDLAYLDQLFPNDMKELESRSVQSMSKSRVENSEKSTPRVQLDNDSNPIKSLIQNVEPTNNEYTSLQDQPMLDTDSVGHQSGQSKSRSWIRTIGQQGPASPAERLNQTARLDSGEFITPFLTMAAFVYFCYVLYI